MTFSEYDLGIPQHPAINVIDSTKLKGFFSCERMFFFEYVLGWRKAGGIHLNYGKEVHECLHKLGMMPFDKALQTCEVLKSCIKSLDALPLIDAVTYSVKLLDEDNPVKQLHQALQNQEDPHKNATKAVLSVVQYITALEKPYNWYIHNGEPAVEIGGSVMLSDEIVLSYRLDGLAQSEDGSVFGVEYKTGGNSPYWATQWETDIQLTVYNLVVMLIAQRSSFVRVQGLLTNKTILNDSKGLDKKDPFRHVHCQWLDVGRNELILENFLTDIRVIWKRLHENFREAERTKFSDTFEAFPRNYKNCSSFYGRPCPYLYYCYSCGNILKDVLTRGYQPAEFEVNYWNPLEEVKKEVNCG